MQIFRKRTPVSRGEDLRMIFEEIQHLMAGWRILSHRCQCNEEVSQIGAKPGGSGVVGTRVGYIEATER